MSSIKTKVKTVVAFLVAAVLLSLSVSCNIYVRNEGILADDYVPQPAGKVKLNYYIAGTDQLTKAINDYVRVFQQKFKDVDVQAMLSSRDRAQIQAEIAAKTVGDVFFLFESDVYNYAQTQRALMPLDYYVEAYGIDLLNIFSAMIDMGTVNGKLYMATCNYNHIIYYYNKDLIRAANLTDPAELQEAGQWDWATFKDYCVRLTYTDEASGKKYCGSTLRLGYSAEYIPFLEGYGGKWYDTENKRVSFVSDENVLRGVREMCDFVAMNCCKYSAVSQSTVGVKSVKKTLSQENFADYNDVNQVCFRAGEHDNMVSIGQNYDSIGIDWDVVAVPALPVHKVGTGCSGFAVFNGTRNPDSAAALALTILTEEGQRAYHGQEGGAVPNIKTLAYNDDYWRVPFEDKSVDPENGKNYNAFISFPEADTYAFVECVIPPEIAEIVRKYMQNVVPEHINGERGVENTLTLLETEANEKWSAIYNG